MHSKIFEGIELAKFIMRDQALYEKNSKSKC